MLTTPPWTPTESSEPRVWIVDGYSDYYPAGGGHDIRGVYTTAAAAHTAAGELVAEWHSEDSVISNEAHEYVNVWRLQPGDPPTLVYAFRQGIAFPTDEETQ